jgi:hypothetical protein
MTVAADVAGVVAYLRLEVARLHAELPRWVWWCGQPATSPRESLSRCLCKQLLIL